MTHPPYTEPEARTRETFLTLMWALSYPGRIQQLPSGLQAFPAIAETLLDLETSCCAADASLHPLLAKFGAQLLPPEQAAYHFYPSVAEKELSMIQKANIGTMLYPDEAATLFIGCALNTGKLFVLQGPGVQGQQAVRLGDIPDAFWALRESACRYPLGWDIYLIDGLQVIGLPRSVRIEAV